VQSRAPGRMALAAERLPAVAGGTMRRGRWIASGAFEAMVHDLRVLLRLARSPPGLKRGR
jgi:hypothetical protein